MNPNSVKAEGGTAPSDEGALPDRTQPAASLPELRRRLSQRRLGELLLAQGMLTAETLERALAHQQRSGLPFGECCRRLDLVGAADLQRVLALQFGFFYTGQTPSDDLVMLREPFGPYGDALRQLCQRLAPRLAASGHKVLAVTSADRGDGRSHLAANLATALAQSGWRTLLIDADLRTPRQHAIFGVPQHPGLSRLLCGHAPPGVRHEPAGLHNLTLITSGPLPPNPLELLSRNELPAFLRWSRERRDIVVLDTPGGSDYPDAESIAAAAGCALVVTAGHRSRVAAVRELMGRLEQRGVEVIGTLMNTPRPGRPRKPAAPPAPPCDTPE